ncbi:MAG TPA: hypothetical protein VMW87_04185 [Spirochaetia bacterium]|nr:hypothetical protein [Spirochaetia bacterium]
MSPEREFISAFLDGEVPSPWKERLETTIAEDPECGRAYAEHLRIHRLLGELPEPDFATAQARVWQKLAARSQEGSPEDQRRVVARPVPVWRRRVSIPVPMALVAAAVVVLMGAFTLIRFLNAAASQSAGGTMAQSVDGLNITVNVKDVEQLLDILNGQNKIRDVKIELPEPHQFKLMGEPLLLRASDASGGLR